MGKLVFVPGIVARLRLVLIFLTCVLATTAIVGFFQVRSLQSTTSGLTQSSVPVFTTVQEMQKDLTVLLLRAQAIQALSELRELGPLQSEVQEKVATLKQNLNKISQQGPMGGSMDDLYAALVAIDGRVSTLVDLKLDIIMREQKFEQFQSVLTEGQQSIRDALEEIAFGEESTQFDTKRIRSDDPAVANLSFAKSLQQALLITELTLEFDAMVNTVALLGSISDSQDLGSIESEMRLKSRGIAVVISQMRESDARRVLASEIVKLKSQIFGDAGVFTQVATLQSLRTDLVEQRDQLAQPILRISTLSDQLLETARDHVEQAGNVVADKSEKLILVLLSSAGLAISLFFATSVLVVEHQINRRMTRLNKAVMAIAAGKLDFPVDVDGQDELGEIAASLETFRENAVELERSNAELEKFAYVAAHDLRSPLRAIRDLAEWTVEDVENSLSDAGRENMDLLQSRVERLNMLLNDLLAYSRAGKEDDDLQQLSLPEVVENTGELLDPNDSFKITYQGPATDVVTYATPLQQILLNLVSNGIKHHDRITGKIKISALVQDGRLFMKVSDDGPGIQPRYHERIFGLFQTLKPRDEVEGSGLGLAIIRKLVEHHGGTIRIISDPSELRGTTFEFDLPEKSEIASLKDRAA